MLAFPEKIITRVYGSTLLTPYEGVGGGQIPRKKALCNTWIAPYTKDIKNVNKLLFALDESMCHVFVGWSWSAPSKPVFSAEPRQHHSTVCENYTGDYSIANSQRSGVLGE